ncbi:MAG: GatB/YqeY domain-containing protein [Burkholderiales bacterium]|nr:GatB/YqeY domain-containing protein [Burkholderiales bacterium]
MSLKDTITEDMKTALRARDTQRLSAIRMLLAAVKQVEVDRRIVVDDAGIVAIVERELKKRRDSVTQYRAAGREDLARNEEFEVGVLSAYLPAQADAAEIAAVIEAAIANAQATGPGAIGKVMPLVKARLAGRADMAQVSALVKARLTP